MKLISWTSISGLNRTFYGIETSLPSTMRETRSVLIVPFMELKLGKQKKSAETFAVLIVPFMELKQNVGAVEQHLRVAS